MKIDDQTIMIFGEYKGAKMENVAASWLLWWWEDAGGWERANIEREERFLAAAHDLHDHTRKAAKAYYEFRLALHDYIKESFAALEKECPDKIIEHRPQ